MARYVDGWVIAVSKRKLDAYKRIARKAGKIWMDHGALEYRECVGEDLNTKMGTPFPVRTKMKRGETVMFSWVVYKSRAHRDRVNKKVMADPRMKPFMTATMPFDVKRMSYGGFEMMVDMT